MLKQKSSDSADETRASFEIFFNYSPSHKILKYCWLKSFYRTKTKFNFKINVRNEAFCPDHWKWGEALYSGVLAFFCFLWMVSLVGWILVFFQLFVFYANLGTTKNDQTGLKEIYHINPSQSWFEPYQICPENFSSVEINRFEFHDFWSNFELVRCSCMLTIAYFSLI